MDPNYGGQDVLRCNLCETPVPSMYCNIFHLKFCNVCVWEHISNNLHVKKKKPHTILPFKKRGSIDKEQIRQQLVP